MEEQVGALWHRLIAGAAQRHYPDAAVTLAEIEKTAGLLFRAFGGDPGLRVAPAAAVRHGARRSWLARIAGLGEKAELTCRDAETLQLPAQLALLPRRELNRDLYLDCRSTHSSRPQRLEPLLNRIVKGMMAAEPDSFPVDRHNRKVARSWMREGTGRVKRLVFKRL